MKTGDHIKTEDILKVIGAKPLPNENVFGLIYNGIKLNIKIYEKGVSVFCTQTGASNNAGTFPSTVSDMYALLDPVVEGSKSNTGNRTHNKQIPNPYASEMNTEPKKQHSCSHEKQKMEDSRNPFEDPVIAPTPKDEIVKRTIVKHRDIEETKSLIILSKEVISFGPTAVAMFALTFTERNSGKREVHTLLVTNHISKCSHEHINTIKQMCLWLNENEQNMINIYDKFFSEITTVEEIDKNMPAMKEELKKIYGD